MGKTTYVNVSVQCCMHGDFWSKCWGENVMGIVHNRHNMCFNKCSAFIVTFYTWMFSVDKSSLISGKHNGCVNVSITVLCNS